MENERRQETLRNLTSSNDIRIRENMVRPNIEVWRDPWIDWVSSHTRKRREETSIDVCDLPGLAISPFCGMGAH